MSYNLMTAMFYLRFLNIAPEDEIKESVEFYYYLNLNDPEIAKQMKDHYDTALGAPGPQDSLHYCLTAYLLLFLDSVASIKRLHWK